MIHEIIPVGPLACNCQVLGDGPGGKALVVDPGDELDRIEQALERHELTVERILFTHAHLDHIGAGAEFKRRTGAPTAMHRLEIPVKESLRIQAQWMGLPPPEEVEIDAYLEEGDRFEFGDREFRVLFTPGHSPGSISFWIPAENKVLAGDVLFQGSIGRTDLPGGDHQALLASIRDKLLTLDDAVDVFPGHGPTTTIGRERRHNPFLQEISRLRAQDAPTAREG